MEREAKVREVLNGRYSEIQMPKIKSVVTIVEVEALVSEWRKVAKVALVLSKYVLSNDRIYLDNLVESYKMIKNSSE